MVETDKKKGMNSSVKRTIIVNTVGMASRIAAVRRRQTEAELIN